jgi:adenosine deaminase
METGQEDVELRQFVEQLPKTETHLHIEGALPVALLGRLGLKPPASWAPNYKFRDFAHFEKELLEMAFAWYTCAEHYHEAAKLIFAEHLKQNVRYVETSFASGVIEFLGLDGQSVLEAIRGAVPQGLQVEVFLGIHHSGGGPNMLPVLEDSLNWEGLAGLDLHGPEDAPLEAWTQPLWEAAGQAGKQVKAHAGEFCGPEFIQTCVDQLGVRHIQHGTRLIEDAALLQELARRGLVLDMCPTSNVKLMPGVTWQNHPIDALMAAGLCVTLSTDDPISFGTSLNDEYLALAEHKGFTKRQLSDLARNGFTSRGLPVPPELKCPAVSS